MSEIIKVIVNELPYGCEVCSWMTYDGYCDVTERALSEVAGKRPDWCPLVEEKHLYKYTMVAGEK